jgi:hypothetical protein
MALSTQKIFVSSVRFTPCPLIAMIQLPASVCRRAASRNGTVRIED